MTDDTKKAGKSDRIRINVNQAFERQHWCKSLGVTKETLRLAVKAAGPMLKDVKAYLIENITNAT